jgi:hypothetical protein
MPATASTATAVDRRMARSMRFIRGAGGSSSFGGQPSALNPSRTALASSSCSAEARIEQRSGRAKLGPDIGSSSVAGGEEFGRSHPARTALNPSQPS